MGHSYSVQVVEPQPSNAVRAHLHPILETGSLSFPRGRYWLDFQMDTRSSGCRITHRIEHAPLVDRLVDEKIAAYVCVVSCPKSSYRETHTTADPIQEIDWNAEDLAESPMFTPMVVCLKDTNLVIHAESDGVHRIWDGQRVPLQAGSRLALGSVVYLQSSMEQLLRLELDSNLNPGQMMVQVDEETFRFKVKLGSSVYRFLRYQKGPQSRNVMNHIVTACFSKLQKEHCEDDGVEGWRSHRALRHLADYFEQREIKHWSDLDFSPEESATLLYPIEVNFSNGDEDLGELA